MERKHGGFTHTCAALPPEPHVFPAYIRSTSWIKSHFLEAAKLPCMPVQSGTSRLEAWPVLQSIRGNGNRIVVDADRIVRSTVLLSGVRPVKTSQGAPVAHYRPSLHDLAIRFPAPYATVNSRIVRAAGSYRVPGMQRYACFLSVPLPTCTKTSASSRKPPPPRVIRSPGGANPLLCTLCHVFALCSNLLYTSHS